MEKPFGDQKNNKTKTNQITCLVFSVLVNWQLSKDLSLIAGNNQSYIVKNVHFLTNVIAFIFISV